MSYCVMCAHVCLTVQCGWILLIKIEIKDCQWPQYRGQSELLGVMVKHNLRFIMSWKTDLRACLWRTSLCQSRWGGNHSLAGIQDSLRLERAKQLHVFPLWYQLHVAWPALLLSWLPIMMECTLEQWIKLFSPLHFPRLSYRGNKKS